jgi:hypothetical protein
MGPSQQHNALPVARSGGTHFTEDSHPGQLLAHGRLRNVYQVSSSLFGVMLLIAAGLKIEPLLSRLYDYGPPSTMGTKGAWFEVTTEWLIAIWLLTGVAGFWARRAAIALLVLFILVTSWRFIGGQADCGCFGNIHVYPGWTLTLDLCGLGLIYWFGRAVFRQPPPQGETLPNRSLRYDRVVFGVLLSITLPVAVLFAQAGIGRHGTVRVVVVDVERLRGKPFPLLDYMDAPNRSRIMKGECILILYNRDCDRCRDYLLRRARTAAPFELGKIYDVDLTPTEAASSDPISSPFKHIRLQQGSLYVSPTPLELSLKAGIVISFSQE